MEDLPIKFGVTQEFTIPEFEGRPATTLSFTNNYTAEKRMVEARVVSGATYSDLEMLMSEGESEMRTNHALVSYEIAKSKKDFEMIKSEFMIDEYPDFLKDKNLKDNATIRSAFLHQKQRYLDAQDRIDFLTALEKLVEGKIKVLNNVSRIMKKEMDIQIRSAFAGNKYISN